MHRYTPAHFTALANEYVTTPENPPQHQQMLKDFVDMTGSFENTARDGGCKFELTYPTRGGERSTNEKHALKTWATIRPRA